MKIGTKKQPSPKETITSHKKAANETCAPENKRFKESSKDQDRTQELTDYGSAFEISDLILFIFI